MEKYTEFLATHIFAQDEIVTYRALSRALKVNVNVAKQMLFEFHRLQNAQKTDSVYATYLLFGVLKSASSDADTEMTDDVAPPALSDPINTCTMSLVSQDKLEDVLKTYASVSSLHVYSLGSNLGNDLQLISEAPKFVPTDDTSDPVENLEVYGGIQNGHLTRRSRRSARPTAQSQPVVKAAPAAKPAAKPLEPGKSTGRLNFSKAVPKKTESKATDSQVSTAESTQSEKPSASSQPAPTKKPAVKTGSIMQSFAKAASRPAKPDPEPKKDSDDEMVLSDDGEDDEPVHLTAAITAEAEEARRAKQAKQEQLRRMMEEDDESEEAPSRAESPEDTPMEEVVTEQDLKANDAKQEEVVSSGNGRKRGRRQVLKKKQTMDANGYFVTVQEKVWESFSEDEEEPPAKKTDISSSISSSASTAKPKKPAPKGQGSIMSFFQKK